MIPDSVKLTAMAVRVVVVVSLHRTQCLKGYEVHLFQGTMGKQTKPGIHILSSWWSPPSGHSFLKSRARKVDVNLFFK